MHYVGSIIDKTGSRGSRGHVESCTRFCFAVSVKHFFGPSGLDGVSRENVWNNHVELGLWGDVMLIAPATCHTLGKMANGLCDNLVLATFLSARCPVVVAPAMDEDMFLHPATQASMATLRSRGTLVLDVNTGSLASGLNGPGRMAEPEEMIQALCSQVFRKHDFAGKKVIISAGLRKRRLILFDLFLIIRRGKWASPLPKRCICWEQM